VVRSLGPHRQSRSGETAARLWWNGGPVKVIPVGSVTAIAIDKGP
jgi:hypothetical protein